MHGRRIGIIGGGPGGLMLAYELQKRANVPYRATIWEASSRLGGKIITNRFAHAPVPYEAGAAELYDYSVQGEDPLRQLITELGLFTTPMDGSRVVMNHAPNVKPWGRAEYQSLDRFDQHARSCISPREFYRADGEEGPPDPMGSVRFAAVLDAIDNPRVRQYVQTLIHSDLATEPHQTNAIYGLQNYLMNDPAYMRLYTIEGGIEQLPKALITRIDAEVFLNRSVARVESTPDGELRIVPRDHADEARHYDFVVVALPNHLLPTIEWGDSLAEPLRRHHAHYDYPAHYLRVTILFEKPFWKHEAGESYFMLDDFEGCCVYDETSRNGDTQHGVLGWLLGGEAAQAMCPWSDAELIDAVLDTLPPHLQHGRAFFLEGRVHRWESAVNGLPSGFPTHRLHVRHQPAPQTQPNLFVVGDYLFDSTLNGVLDSAHVVAEWLTAELELERTSPHSS